MELKQLRDDLDVSLFSQSRLGLPFNLAKHYHINDFDTSDRPVRTQAPGRAPQSTVDYSIEDSSMAEFYQEPISRNIFCDFKNAKKIRWAGLKEFLRCRSVGSVVDMLTG